MPPRRPKKGARRIDAAIDHFTTMGYATADIRTVVKDLLKVYGDNGWPFLEEGSYRVVQEALFDKEEQLQLQLLQQEEEHQQPQQLDGAMEDAPIENNMPIVEMHEVPAEAEPTVEEMQEALFQKQKEEQLQLQLFQHEEEQEDQQPQQLEGTIHEAPLESNMPIVEVYVVPAEAEPLVEEVDPMLVDEPATVICGTRRPCYGWLIEYVSESDTEEEMHVPSQESLPCKRKLG